MRGLAERKGAGLLYGTNFSIGVQALLKLAQTLGAALKGAGYTFAISETHHASKLDSPSGTAITLARTLEAAAGTSGTPIESLREGDHAGLHTLTATSDADSLTLRHESFSRRGFAEGAVRAAEWLAHRTGCYDFQQVFDEM
jgi:4-hydroxy-tetrahydrodipicolinate reductase